jgi:hypothetical protein
LEAVRHSAYAAPVAITVRNPTHDSTCSCCGLPVRQFSGEVELHGGRPLYLCELRSDGGERNVWMAFIIGPWRAGDGSDGAWVSVRAHLVGDDLGCTITDAGESPLGTHELLRRLRGLERAVVFARSGAPEYFFNVGDQILRDREVFDFLMGPRAVVVT